jgi:EAL domain-containing protein (putative c-di-GMP-specific phosphodiesterase class I)
VIKQGGRSSWNGVLARVLTRQHVRAVYQPIVRLATGAVEGYEALARPANVADDGSVEDFFRSARAEGVIRDLDWLCRRAALDGARGMGSGPFLSLNLNPDALQNTGPDVEALLQLVTAAGRPVGDLVIEVVRPPAVTGVAELIGLLAPYRSAGIRLAIAGVTPLDEPLLLASAAQPDFIKLSRPATVSIESPECRVFVERCVARAGQGGPVLIAEGIELDSTATRLAAAGVTLGQGYLLGRPAAMDREGRLRADTATAAGPEAG